jgi:hypothetical protein
LIAVRRTGVLAVAPAAPISALVSTLISALIAALAALPAPLGALLLALLVLLLILAGLALVSGRHDVLLAEVSRSHRRRGTW